MKILLLLTTILLTGCFTSKNVQPPLIQNSQPTVPFNVLDLDNNGTISQLEYSTQGVNNYSTEEPVITILVIVLCVVLLTGGLAWIYRSSDKNNDNIYDQKE